ncbi:ATP-dependent Clp protease ATP-binding subunit [Candidatus Aerophobetes bacterium]|uniref:ATP-dependent Clp protease ATP-binding subunit n=1 Tax=Aerophobetes bacterium TaxID=2030807 RepID=A0A523ZFZ6_UNCAE|nr:MAG: ATP-dependent Clp protease ATP-binding subunit [Candidatus Aerophobetes bacterium]
MFNRFTERAKKVIFLAREEARRLDHDYLGTEHILLGLIREGEGIGAAALQNLAIDLAQVRAEVEKAVGRGGGTLFLGQIPFTPRAKKVLELAVTEARNLGHNYIGTEHLLLGLIREAEGVAAQILTSLGADLGKVREEVSNLLGTKVSPEQVAKPSQTPTLDRFGRDLTRLARDGELDPVINRQKEIERLIQILSRRTKNNPVLIGEAGVGKTAIAEGLAQKIFEGSLPEPLLNRRVVTIDLGGIVAGTKYRGEFEKRMERILNEIRKAKNVILFIDEIHTLVGAGAAEGAIDASNILKPALARGELQCIGATTLDEYRKYIERDEALERRFQTIIVNEPTVKETIQILRGLRDKYEAFHRVKITDEALITATKLSYRYIQGRYLPDKAIDVMDEAAARVRLQFSTRPKELKKIEKELEQLRKEKEAAVKAQEFEKAANMRDKEKNLKDSLSKGKGQWEADKGKKGKQEKVTEKDVAHIVSSWTGVPLRDLTEAESKRLLRMEEAIHVRVVGQEEPIKAIAQSIRRAQAGIKNMKRPIGVFMFLGPTGVGKTYLAQALAEFLFGDEDAIITLDMSEYMEKFSVSRLTGAPPGYVGYEEGGELTEKVRRRPYSVVLLDEIEKAHPDVFNILLQIMDNGRLSDNLGHTVDFRNTVLIMTSNLGAEQIVRGSNLGFQAEKEGTLSYEEMKNRVMSELKRSFRPEFLNRLDEVIVFHALNKKEVKKIVDMLLEEKKELLEEREMNIEITQEARNLIAQEGYDPDFGARPLRRAIQKLIDNSLSEEILKGRFKDGEDIVIGIKNGNIVFNKKKKSKVGKAKNKMEN